MLWYPFDRCAIWVRCSSRFWTCLSVTSLSDSSLRSPADRFRLGGAGPTGREIVGLDASGNVDSSELTVSPGGDDGKAGGGVDVCAVRSEASTRSSDLKRATEEDGAEDAAVVVDVWNAPLGYGGCAVDWAKPEPPPGPDSAL